MAMLFSDIQSEIKRRATKNQGGTQFDAASKTLANSSLFRISREAPWKPLRRTTSFETEAKYTTGTISATNNSKSFTSTSVDLITNGIEVGRRIDIQGSSLSYVIDTITGENAFTTNLAYDGTTASGLTHTISGKETYNLPIQTGRVAFLWHEEFGYPYTLQYVPDISFFQAQPEIATDDTPRYYREWGQDNVLEQPLEGSVVTISSSDSSDTSKGVTVFGTVSGYPDFETITTDASNGTTASAGSKSFTKIERVVKDSSTTGRITGTTNTTNVTAFVLPVGDATGTIEHKKVSLWPIPDTTFPINVWYYKDPWRMVNSGDIHELGQDFDEAIILLSVAKIKYETSQKEGDRWMAMYNDELRTLRRKNSDKLDYIPTLKRPHESNGTRSRLHKTLAYQQIGSKFGPMSR